MSISFRGITTLGVAAALIAAPTMAQTVSPTSITSNPSGACGGGTEMHNVCITLPPGSTVDAVDVFLLFDDTGSFAGNVPATIAVFNAMVAALQAALPGVDLAFGVGRFEDYGGPGTGFSGEVATGRPFTLNQAIIRTANPAFNASINTALANTAPGFGGDGPETAIAEGLWQVATGGGFDGDGNGSSLDSGPAGAMATQTAPGNSGDVPPFSSYVGISDGTGGGVGWRAGALHIVILATDICSVAAYDPALGVPATIVGTGSTEPTTAYHCASAPGSSRFGFVSNSKTSAGNTVVGAVVPAGAGTVPNTIAALNGLGIRVIGLAPGGAPTASPGPSGAPSVFLSALARTTGAVDGGGNPLVFNIAGGAGPIAAAIVAAVTTTTTLPINIILTSDPALADLTVTPNPAVRPAVAPGDTACFDVTFTGNGSFAGGAFNLRFRDQASNSILGTIPVDLRCPTGVITVPIDVFPFFSPLLNRVYLSKATRKIPVLVLGSAGFNTADINPATVRFGPTGTEAPPMFAPLLFDANGDGFGDAMYDFRTSAAGFALGDTSGTLTGSTFGGTPITGSDAVAPTP